MRCAKHRLEAVRTAGGAELSAEVAAWTQHDMCALQRAHFVTPDWCVQCAWPFRLATFTITHRQALCLGFFFLAT